MMASASLSWESQQTLTLLASGVCVEQTGPKKSSTIYPAMVAAAREALAVLQALGAMSAPPLKPPYIQYPLNGRPWQAADDALLLERFQQGEPPSSLADAMQRSPSAIQRRLETLLGQPDPGIEQGRGQDKA